MERPHKYTIINFIIYTIININLLTIIFTNGMNIYNIHNFVLPKQRRPSYLYNVSMYFPNPKRVVDENNSSSFSFFTPYYKRYEDDHAKHTNKNEHGSYVPEYIDIIDYKKYTKQKISLVNNGFEYIDLKHSVNDYSLYDSLKEALTNGLTDTLAYKIRKQLSYFFTTLSDGSYLWILHIVDEGMVIRRNKPGCDPHECEPVGNDEVGAKTVHGDQDLHGEPLHSMLFGLAPFLFHPIFSPLKILNIWIPLQEVRVRPLALMDVQSLNRKEHQLRYHIINKFMKNGQDDFLLNDCWTFLHHKHQKWFFYEGQTSNKAIVFETMGTPHGSFMVPGEKYLRKVLNGLIDIHDHVIKRKEDDCFPLKLKDKMLDILRQNNLTHAHSPRSIKLSLEEIQEFIIHTVLQHGIVDDDKETICIHDITEFKLKMEHLIAVNTRVSLEMRAVGIVVTHNTFMYLLSVLIIAISSWKLFSFLLVNLLLKPNKNMVGICRRWLKSLFQIADNTDGR